MNNEQKKAINKQKKLILIVMAALVAFVVLYFVIGSIDFEKLFKKDDATENKEIYFYDESLSKNIFQDEKYMELDRTVNLVKASMGTGKTIDDQDAVTEGPAVNLIYNMIGYMISGNNEAYNSCFSTEYYKYAQPIGKFTQQKLYNITITEVSKTDKTDENGNTYVEYYYTLEYMIRHNNGSLRKDMGSDCIKAQHIFLSERYGDEVLIDKIATIEYVQK